MSQTPAPKESMLVRAALHCTKKRLLLEGAAVGFAAGDVGSHLIPVVGHLVGGPVEAALAVTGVVAAYRARRAARKVFQDRGIEV